MKFQTLTIHHIASIEDATIAFDKEPLSNSEVFLITGKTGAGKSTILDAICLALYANTPRLEYTKMQGDVPDQERTYSIDDPRQLMRRNTAEAFVTLTFIGSNGIHYEATWSVTRAYNKLTGNLQGKKWQLRNLDADTILTKDKDIKAEIASAIGLDFEQFCRTTLLAQGEFTRFLNSTDGEKAEILEKITGVDIYSRIGAKVYAVTGQKEQEWKDARTKVEGIRTLTDDEISDKKKEISSLTEQWKLIQAETEKYNDKCIWMRNNLRFADELHRAEDELRQAREVLLSDEFKEKQQFVNDWNATIEARNWMTLIQQAETTRNAQQQKLSLLNNRFALLLGQQQTAQQAIDRMTDELHQTDAFLKSQEPKAPVYAQAQTIASLLHAISTHRTAISQQQSAINHEQQQLSDVHQPALNQEKASEKAALDAFTQVEAQVSTMEESLAQLHLSDLRSQRDNAISMIGKITTAIERIDTYGKAIADNRKKEQLLRQQKQSIDDMQQKATAMAAPVHDAEIRMKAKKEVLDRQSDTVNKFAQTLRTRLKIGDICPVCRQEITHDIPHEEELSALVSGLQTEYKEAQDEYNNLVQEKIQIEAAIKSESETYVRNLQALHEDRSVAESRQKALASCNDCGISDITPDTREKLLSLKQSQEENKTRLEEQIKTGESRENEVRSLRKLLETKRKAHESAAVKVQEAEKTITACRTTISNAQAVLQSHLTESSKAEQEVSRLITPGLWSESWQESPQEFAGMLTRDAKKFTDKTTHRQTLVLQQQTAKTNAGNTAHVIDQILSAMPEWNDTPVQPSEAVTNLQQEASDINTEVATALTHLQTARHTLEENQALLNTFLHEQQGISMDRLNQLNAFTSQDVAIEDDKLKKDRDAVVARESLLTNARKVLEDHQGSKPQLEPADTLESMTQRMEDLNQQQTALAEKKGGLNQELKTDEDNKKQLGTLIKAVEKKKADYQRWAGINELIGDSTGKKFRKIAQSYVLASLIHSANSYMQTLTDRYTLKVDPGTFIISIEDAYQGYVSRATSTISGGESFLVSLSLALALSDIGQTLSVDTLFIDEGFGTLSGESLQNAITTLRTLHTHAGRHVGIISHVEELKDRIPVQIQVNQEDHNSCSTIQITP